MSETIHAPLVGGALQRFDVVMPPDETIYVTAVPAIGRIEFTNTDGMETHLPVTGLKPSEATEITDALAETYMMFGPGIHDPDAVPDEPGRSWPSGVSVKGVLGVARHIPQDVMHVSFGAEKNVSERLRLGWLAIAARKPSEAEKEQYEEIVAARRLVVSERARERAHAAEAGKTDLTVYDHATVVVDGTAYLLSLDAPQSIVAARVIQTLVSKLPAQRRHVELSNIAVDVWGAMPLAERSLLTSREREQYGGSTFIKPMVDGVLNSLTNTMGISRRSNIAGLYGIQRKKMSIAFMPEPVTTEEQAAAIPVFPPGISKDSIREGGILEPTAQERTRAAALLDMARDGIVPGPKDAIMGLGDVMDGRVKRAMYMLLAEAGNAEALATTLQSIHGLLERSLGSSYWHARRARTIAGHTTTSARLQRAKHRSGGLPLSTKPDVSSSDHTVTTRWTVGYLK